MTIEEQNRQIIELEDEIQTSEDARLRLEVTLAAKNQEIEKLKGEIDEISDYHRDSFQQRLKNYELEIEDLRKSKQLILQQRDKSEQDLQAHRQMIEELNQQKDQLLKNNRRLQVNRGEKSPSRSIDRFCFRLESNQRLDARKSRIKSEISLVARDEQRLVDETETE